MRLHVTKLVFSSWLDVGQTTEGTRVIQDLFTEKVFPFSKPKSLLRTLVIKQQRIVTESSSTFSPGSGTHPPTPVLDLNKEDSGNRKFILVQLPEPTGREDYPTITDIAKERVRRVIKKLNEEDAAKGPGLFDENTPKPDRGFRDFLKLASPTFKPWECRSASRCAGARTAA